MADSDSSSLSSALGSDDERIRIAPIFLKAKANAKKQSTIKVPKKPKQTAPPPSPPRPPRSPSPIHYETLADNPDIAFIVMFRSRFSSAFPPKLAHLGPQDIERGVEGPAVSPQVESLLCALLGIVLNRKKPVEQGHYGKALEEAMATQKPQWPRSWEGQNPLQGSKNFNTLSPSERLTLLRTLVLWALSSSEVISQAIKESYKQNRHEDDLNQPLSVQPWGQDGDRRRYWLIEGQDDTSFRLYRENARSQTEEQWWSIGGSIEEMKVIAEKLDTKDTTQAARRLSSKILAAIPRFEATEEKRRRREYRQIRKAQFARPEPGFSLYEGRTRGKRMRYAYDDDDDFDESDYSVRRSGRHSDRSTPAESNGPVVTASGRQVRAREGGMYGESLLSGQSTAADSPATMDGSEGSTRASRQATRGGMPRKRNFDEIYNGTDEEDDAASSGGWNSADNEDEGDQDGSDADDDLSDAPESDEEEVASLVVKLKVPSLERKEQTPVFNDNIDLAPQPVDTSEVIVEATAPMQSSEIIAEAIEPTKSNDPVPEIHHPTNGRDSVTQTANGVNHTGPITAPRSPHDSKNEFSEANSLETIAKTEPEVTMNGHREDEVKVASPVKQEAFENKSVAPAQKQDVFEAQETAHPSLPTPMMVDG